MILIYAALFIECNVRVVMTLNFFTYNGVWILLIVVFDSSAYSLYQFV